MSQGVIRGIALPPAAQPGDPLARVDTPSLALDLAAFGANLRAMQAWADRHGVALRPPRPTSVPRSRCASWRWARAACCQKVSEACPSSPQACAASATRWWARPSWRCWPSWRAPRISVCVDNAANLAHISRAMAAPASGTCTGGDSTWAGAAAGRPTGATVLALAQQARDLPGVNFAGLQAYHGSVQHARGRERPHLPRRRAHRRVPCPAAARTASPATPSPAAAPASKFDAGGVYTSCRPAPYAFMDGDYGANEWGGGR